MLDFGFYNMDCMEGMKEFPDKYFDLAIVDPPYGDGGYIQTNGQEPIRRGVRPLQEYLGGVARKTEIPPRAGTLCADSGRETVSRTGGTWAAKFGKKLLRGI